MLDLEFLTSAGSSRCRLGEANDWPTLSPARGPARDVGEGVVVWLARWAVVEVVAGCLRTGSAGRQVRLPVTARSPAREGWCRERGGAGERGQVRCAMFCSKKKQRPRAKDNLTSLTMTCGSIVSMTSGPWIVLTLSLTEFVMQSPFHFLIFAKTGSARNVMNTKVSQLINT